MELDANSSGNEDSLGGPNSGSVVSTSAEFAFAFPTIPHLCGAIEGDGLEHL